MMRTSWAHPFLADPGRPIVLASQSPRRREILAAQALPFEVVVPSIDETAWPEEDPASHVERLALEKARAVAARCPGALVIGCDTVVVLGDAILGKPQDEEDARAMLRRLSGARHVVHSSVALVTDTAAVGDHDTTEVWFRELGDEEIARYVRTGEPMDKAGAYGIQGAGALLVDRIDGGYFTVMGLPLGALLRLWNPFCTSSDEETPA